MRFPSRLLGANMLLALMVWAGYFLVVTAITVGIAVFGTLTGSVWESATQLTRWFALFIGVGLVREFLPLYIAHGQTRRQFGAQAAVTVTLFAPFLSALITAGYLLEKVLYGLAGWPHVLGRSHLFTEPAQVPLVFAEYLIEFLVWIVAGAFIGAGFYRWGGGGLLTIPVGVGLVVLANAAVGTDLRLPFIRNIGLDLPQSPAMTVGVALGMFLLGLALTWAVIRDVPLRNKPS
ncbi:hypothetical protein [Planotetraspora sp. GP83]|uniref:hypothetical protein n=1 Tax=Planotetraspora sp. GP83 TaxID=3156264 RepID=UPI003519312A